MSDRKGEGSSAGSVSIRRALRAFSCVAALRRAYTSPPMRPTTVDRAMPKTPQWKTKVKRVLRTTLMTFDQIPAHMVARVSWCALTIESGRIDQNEVKADPPMRTLP